MGPHAEKGKMSGIMVFEEGGMKKAAILAAAGVVVIGLSTALGAANEERDWNSASRRNSVSSYDQYLASHPSGAHAGEARQKAVEQSKLGLAGTARSCHPDFLLMLYYVAAGERLELEEAALAEALDRAASCNFSRRLNYEERARRTELALEARDQLEPLSGDRLPVKALLDLDHLLFGLEISVIEDAEKIVKSCRDQSAWTDTTAARFQQCAAVHLERQARMIKAIARQVEYDLDRIGELEDRDDRRRFWDRWDKLCRDKTFLEVIFKFRLASRFEEAKARESDPKLKKKIEKVERRVKGYEPRK